MTIAKKMFLQILLFPVLPVLAKGPNPDDFNKPTETEKAQTETAARMFNLYLEGKPVTDAYLADISRDPALTAGTVKGEAAVDLAKLAPVEADPNRGLDLAARGGMAGKRAKVMDDISQDAVSQQAAGKRSAVENALGIQSTANTAQAGMARDAVDRNISAAQSDYNSSATNMSSLASLAGAGAGMARSYRKGEVG